MKALKLNINFLFQLLVAIKESSRILSWSECKNVGQQHFNTFWIIIHNWNHHRKGNFISLNVKEIIKKVTNIISTKCPLPLKESIKLLLSEILPETKPKANHQTQFSQNHSLLIVWKGQFTFEKTPDYMHDPRVPSRMYHFKPDLKIIAVICDPVHRTFSHYLHATNIQRPDGWEMPGAQAIQEKWVGDPDRAIIELYFRTFEEVVYQALKESINSTLAQWLITLPEEEIPYALVRDKWHQYLDRNMKSGRRYLMPSSILARSSYGYLLAHWYRKVSKKA